MTNASPADASLDATSRSSDGAGDGRAITDAARPLRVVALDEDDLTVVSALVQDALTKPAEMRYIREPGAFALTLNRLAREERPRRRGPLGLRREWQRRRSLLEFRRVLRVRRRGFGPDRSEPVLSLLAVRFEPSSHDPATENDPSGTIVLEFAGNASLRLDVEVIETRLTDLGPAWASQAMPRH